MDTGEFASRILPTGRLECPCRSEIASEVALFGSGESHRLRRGERCVHSRCRISSMRRRDSLLLGPIRFFVLVFAYLVVRRVELHRRNRRSWGAIVEKLRPGLGKAAKSAEVASDMDKSFTNQAIERRARSAQSRREMYRGTGAMMEMADYAEQNGGVTTAPAVMSLRSLAVAIRIATAKDAIRIPTQK